MGTLIHAGDQGELSLTTVTSHGKPGFGFQLTNRAAEPRAGRAGPGLLSQSLPGSGTTTNETPSSAEMKPEPPLGIPVVFQTDLLLSPSLSAGALPAQGSALLC